MKKDISDIFIMHLHKLLIYLVILVIIPNSLFVCFQTTGELFVYAFYFHNSILNYS